MDNDGQLVTKDQLLIGNWTPIRNEVLFSNVLSQGAKLCYGAICSHLFKGGDKIAWPGQKRLARMINTSDRTIRRYLDELQDVGLLHVERRGLTKTNLYSLHEPDVKRLKSTVSVDTDTACLGDRTPVSTQERTPLSYKEDQVRSEDCAEFPKGNSLQSKDTIGVSVEANDKANGFSPVSGILDRYIQSKTEGGNDE